MDAIVCVDRNWAIGYDDKLLYHIDEDMNRFTSITKNNIVIMGRKTLDSLPNKQPLKDRINIVLTREKRFSIHENLIYMNSIDEVLDYCNSHAQKSFCIGGDEIYKLFLPYCKTAYVTRIKGESKYANRYFENLDMNRNWVQTIVGKPRIQNGVWYRFDEYVNAND